VKVRENRLVALVCLVCLVCLVEQDQLDELNKPDGPDEPDRRFTRKRCESVIAAETFMNMRVQEIRGHGDLEPWIQETLRSMS
jgi:hypothetical protein